ncbi:MAG: DNA-directed RNA polymerase subunit H [archaeon]
MAEPAKKFDVTQHSLVPAHSILSEAETKEVLAKFNISTVQLPNMQASDPVAKAIGAKPGNVIKIERKTQSGKADYYRFVTE